MGAGVLLHPVFSCSTLFLFVDRAASQPLARSSPPSAALRLGFSETTFSSFSSQLHLRNTCGQSRKGFSLCVRCAATNGSLTFNPSGHNGVDSGGKFESLNGSPVEHEVGNAISETAEALGVVTAKITTQIDQFFSRDIDGDPDHPSGGFSSIVVAIEAIRKGKFVIVVDDEDRENEGDLIMAGSLVTSESMAFLVKHTTGIVCAAMKGEDLDRLKLPLMVADMENEETLRTAFTVSVDLKAGTTTGVSASDRAKTIRALACPDSKPEFFRKPGHVFPLRYREGGVLKRAGHTEASADLVTMAGLSPVGVLCEIVDEVDGSMARLPRLREFAKRHDLPLISIADLVRYRRKREKLVERTAVARLPTKWGIFQAYSYRSKLDGIEHVAMVKGKIRSLSYKEHTKSYVLQNTFYSCGRQWLYVIQNGAGKLQLTGFSSPIRNRPADSEKSNKNM